MTIGDTCCMDGKYCLMGMLMVHTGRVDGISPILSYTPHPKCTMLIYYARMAKMASMTMSVPGSPSYAHPHHALRARLFNVTQRPKLNPTNSRVRIAFLSRTRETQEQITTASGRRAAYHNSTGTRNRGAHFMYFSSLLLTLISIYLCSTSRSDNAPSDKRCNCQPHDDCDHTTTVPTQ